MNRNAAVLAAAVVAALAPSLPASAQFTATFWSAISTSCTPDSLSEQDDRYQSPNDNYVTAQKGSADPVALICGVLPQPFLRSIPSLFAMTYVDATGSAKTAHVQARFIRVSRTTGARAVIATLDSDNAGATGVNQIETTFEHFIDFDANYYYVRIDMDRQAGSQNIRSIGVSLVDQRT